MQCPAWAELDLFLRTSASSTCHATVSLCTHNLCPKQYIAFPLENAEARSISSDLVSARCLPEGRKGRITLAINPHKESHQKNLTTTSY